MQIYSLISSCAQAPLHKFLFFFVNMIGTTAQESQACSSQSLSDLFKWIAQDVLLLHTKTLSHWECWKWQPENNTEIKCDTYTRLPEYHHRSMTTDQWDKYFENLYFTSSCGIKKKMITVSILLLTAKHISSFSAVLAVPVRRESPRQKHSSSPSVSGQSTQRTWPPATPGQASLQPQRRLVSVYSWQVSLLCLRRRANPPACQLAGKVSLDSDVWSPEPTAKTKGQRSRKPHSAILKLSKSLLKLVSIDCVNLEKKWPYTAEVQISTSPALCKSWQPL